MQLFLKYAVDNLFYKHMFLSVSDSQYLIKMHVCKHNLEFLNFR